MNFAYFRKSHRNYEATLQELDNAIAQSDWKKIGEAEMESHQGKMLMIYKAEWLDKLAEIDHRLLGLMPFSITVLKKGDEIVVGSGQTQLLRALAMGQEMGEMAHQTEEQLKEMIHHAAQVGEAKLESVKLYSSMTCPYCKMEQKWLEEHKIDHQVVYVDLQQEEAEKLVQRTGQLGVPVTEVIFEESDPEYVVGFDRERLQDMLKVEKSVLVRP